MALNSLSPISSAGVPTGDGGTRDVAVDFTNKLETAEVIANTTVTSSDAAVLSIANETWNPAPITREDGGVIAIGKGVQFQIETLAAVTRTVTVDVVIEGNSGTKESYELPIRITDKLRK